MEIRERVSVWDQLKKTDKPIVLYGMGNGADKILDELMRRGILAAGVFASDEFCRGQEFRGFPVINYVQAKEQFGEMIVLVAFGTRLPEVMERIRRLAQEQELYVPDVPVVGEGLFDADYAEAHKGELKEVYEMLADRHSCRVFEDMLAYKISGKPDYLWACESDVMDAFRDVLGIHGDESYADVGAYTGDTIRELIGYAGGYREIFAIEPDHRNFAKLARYAEGMDSIRCFNIAAHEEAGELPFAARGGRNSALGQGAAVCKESLDSLLAGERITYMKFDVEGEECPALKGAAHILQEQTPKLLISAYHRNEDLFAIPLLVKRIQPEYKVYLRHYSYIPAWDTNYYFLP